MDEVSKRAEEILAQAHFNADCNKVADAGKAAFPDFEDALVNLRALGALSEQNLELIVSTGTDEAARILYEFGADPAEAKKILALPPARLALELGKRAAAKPVKATAPVSSVTPSASAAPRDDMGDAEYFSKRIAQRKARR
jgi:hypothetical protein